MSKWRRSREFFVGQMISVSYRFIQVLLVREAEKLAPDAAVKDKSGFATVVFPVELLRM